jgi:menaquinone-dependent protoporphyrinogen IX oxidase
MFRFMKAQHAALAQKPLFAWITCIRVLEPDGFHHVLAHYVPQDLHEFPLLQNIGIFAGKIDPTEITDKERWTLYLRYDGAEMMSRLKGDFREWSKIRAWTHHAAHTLLNLSSTE